MKNLLILSILVLFASCNSEELQRCVDTSNCNEVTLQTEADTNDEQDNRLDDLEKTSTLLNNLTLTTVLSIGAWNVDEDRDTSTEFAFSKQTQTIVNGAWRQIEILFVTKNLSEVRHVLMWERKTTIMVFENQIEKLINVWNEVGGNGSLRTIETYYNIGTDEWMELLINGNILIDGTEHTVIKTQ